MIYKINALSIKRVIDRKRPTCQNNNRLHTQQLGTPLEITNDVFKSVPDLCFIALFAVLGKAKSSATIDHSVPVEID